MNGWRRPTQTRSRGTQKLNIPPSTSAGEGCECRDTPVWPRPHQRRSKDKRSGRQVGRTSAPQRERSEEPMPPPSLAPQCCPHPLQRAPCLPQCPAAAAGGRRGAPAGGAGNAPAAHAHAPAAPAWLCAPPRVASSPGFPGRCLGSPPPFPPPYCLLPDSGNPPVCPTTTLLSAFPCSRVPCTLQAIPSAPWWMLKPLDRLLAFDSATHTCTGKPTQWR